jgi:hypothetical protein
LSGRIVASIVGDFVFVVDNYAPTDSLRTPKSKRRCRWCRCVRRSTAGRLRWIAGRRAGIPEFALAGFSIVPNPDGQNGNPG